MLRLFSAGVQAPPKGTRVVYIDGEADGIAGVLRNWKRTMARPALYRTVIGHDMGPVLLNDV